MFMKIAYENSIPVGSIRVAFFKWHGLNLNRKELLVVSGSFL